VLGQVTLERVEVVIGSGSTARVVITPLVRGDEHWVECDVAIQAGAFRGTFRASLRPEEFAAFRGDLERLHRDLRGPGRFDSMERQVAIEIRGDGRGHFKGSCRLRDRAGDGNLLECEVEFDQTDIPAMLQQLADVGAAFPPAAGIAG
jgi:hypothetical protein